MSDFLDDLLQAAARLPRRKKGQKGPLKAAYVRRSVSTTYYAIFHFCLDEAAQRLIGTDNNLRQRRRLLARALSHTGLETTFGKLKGSTIDKSMEDVFRLPSTPNGPITTPDFVKQLASVYLDAKAMREDADYNLNGSLSEIDAHKIHRRIKDVIKLWKQSTAASDRDMKHAIALVLFLKGKLRD